MFVLQSTYDAEVHKRRTTEMQLQAILIKWNALVDRINAKGGKQFLSGELQEANNLELTKEDINKLLVLCHPDKHNNKPIATEVTAKLNALKAKL